MVSANVCMRVWKSNDIKLWARDNQVDQISSTAFKRQGLRVHSFHRLLCIFLQKLARLRYLTLVTYGLKHLHWMKYTPCPKKKEQPFQWPNPRSDITVWQSYCTKLFGFSHRLRDFMPKFIYYTLLPLCIQRFNRDSVFSRTRYYQYLCNIANITYIARCCLRTARSTSSERTFRALCLAARVRVQLYQANNVCPSVCLSRAENLLGNRNTNETANLLKIYQI